MAVKKLAFKSLAAAGIVLALVAIGLELFGAVRGRPVEVPHTVYWGAMLFGFVGFFGLNPDGAERGASVATRVVTSVLNALPVPRFGRRSSDAVAVPGVATTVVAKPVEPPVEPEKDETVERPRFPLGGE